MAPRTKKPMTAHEMQSRGGKANTPAQLAARRRNAKKGGRPQEYQVRPFSDKRDAPASIFRRDSERELRQLTPRALDVLSKWMRTNRPDDAINAFDDGVIYFERKEK